jgi:hypothetical protein
MREAVGMPFRGMLVIRKTDGDKTAIRAYRNPALMPLHGRTPIAERRQPFPSQLLHRYTLHMTIAAVDHLRSSIGLLPNVHHMHTTQRHGKRATSKITDGNNVRSRVDAVLLCAQLSYFTLQSVPRF